MVQDCAQLKSLLDPLPFPIYFVRKEPKWDLIKDDYFSSIEHYSSKFSNGADCWTIQTYLNLKHRGLDVHLSSNYVPGQICVTAYDDLAISDFPFNSYIVVCRHDRARPEICELRVVQNLLNVLDSSDHFIPFWPQPLLQPRKQERKARIENLVYKGLEMYLAKPFKDEEFLTKLSALGINLITSKDALDARCNDWTNYTEADVVLAVRNVTDYDLSIKPASKLINAWFAGCPALLGPEPAYQALRRSELDYIEVRSPDEVIAALKKLQNHPELYMAMVENGLQRAQEFTPDQISKLWRDFLAGKVSEGYEQWLRQPKVWKTIGRPIQFGWRAVKHKIELRYFFKNINDGPRPFPEST